MQLKTIGIIHTPFHRPEGTPIQPSLSPGTEGWVEIFAPYVAGLKDLAGFERIWLLTWLDRVTEERLIVVPFLDKVERGVFATRAPSRPNPIGLSCVRLLEVRKHILRVQDVDMLDGTPLIDIKPYAPRLDHFTTSRNGWLDTVDFKNMCADSRFEGRAPGG
ncbi:MAG: tRNA (N6-threonylcarbamoyladenosine(37)-N6)-methyltransferase TrmO [Planctomycetota bacterium]